MPCILVYYSPPARGRPGSGPAPGARRRSGPRSRGGATRCAPPPASPAPPTCAGTRSLGWGERGGWRGAEKRADVAHVKVERSSRKASCTAGRQHAAGHLWYFTSGLQNLQQEPCIWSFGPCRPGSTHLLASCAPPPARTCPPAPAAPGPARRRRGRCSAAQSCPLWLQRRRARPCEPARSWPAGSTSCTRASPLRADSLVGWYRGVAPQRQHAAAGHWASKRAQAQAGACPALPPARTGPLQTTHPTAAAAPGVQWRRPACCARPSGRPAPWAASSPAGGLQRRGGQCMEQRCAAKWKDLHANECQSGQTGMLAAADSLIRPPAHPAGACTTACPTPAAGRTAPP